MHLNHETQSRGIEIIKYKFYLIIKEVNCQMTSLPSRTEQLIENTFYSNQYFNNVYCINS